LLEIAFEEYLNECRVYGGVFRDQLLCMTFQKKACMKQLIIALVKIFPDIVCLKSIYREKIHQCDRLGKPLHLIINDHQWPVDRVIIMGKR
jgi:hypothetical protein